MNGTIGFIRASHLDCPNHSAFVSKAELDRLKAAYQDLVARGAVIPPAIEALAKQLGLTK